MRQCRNEYTLTDAYKPWVSSPSVVSLPDSSLPINDTISLSSSDPLQDDDCLVAANLDDFTFAVCRPQDSGWTHYKHRFRAGTITYSKRYKAFYFTCPDPKKDAFYLSFLKLSNTDKHKLSYPYHIGLRNIPKNISLSVLQNTCDMSRHLVDSPSGDLFFILWFTTVERVPNECPDSTKKACIGLKRFLVFREDVGKHSFTYTKDIGDLCIFLGKNEAFCVSANMYPGLRANSIYYTYPYPTRGPGIGCYSLASSRTRSLSSDFSFRHGIFWMQPADPVA